MCTELFIYLVFPVLLLSHMDSGKSMHSVQKDGQVGMAETMVTPKDSMVKDETSRTSEEFKQHRSKYKPLNNLTLKDSVVKDETSRTSEDFKQYISENQPLKKRKIQMKEGNGCSLLLSVDAPSFLSDIMSEFLMFNFRSRFCKSCTINCGRSQ